MEYNNDNNDTGVPDFSAVEQKREEEWQKLADSYQAVASLLKNEWAQVRQGHADLEAKREALVKGDLDVDSTEILSINAGGEIIQVSRGTLMQMKGTVLEILFCGGKEDQFARDSAGNIFLDISPTAFRCIIDYLNDIKLAPPDNPPSLPSTDAENEASLDRLCLALGLKEHFQLYDSKILSESEKGSEYKDAIVNFLREDDITGNLKLLYRGTRDGMKAGDFHSRCDDRGPILVLVKTTRGYIFGGYSGVPWGSGPEDGTVERVESENAFLFSLKCCQSSEFVKMRPNEPSKALTFDRNSGPVFGHSLTDLRLLWDHGEGWLPNRNRLGERYHVPSGWKYKSLTGATFFNLAEIEVFGSEEPSQSNELEVDHLPDSLRKAIIEEKATLMKVKDGLFERSEAFGRQVSVAKAFCLGTEEKIAELNVSGQRMSVSHNTLELFPDSVLYKQFVDPNWSLTTKRRRASADQWSPDEVKSWVRSLGCSVDISDSFSTMNGAELLSLEREDIKDMGINNPGSVALLAKWIQKIRDEEAKNSAHFVEHSPYCMGKILDHMRLLAMEKQLGICSPTTPTIRDGDKERFKRVVEYYFPTEEMASKFLG